MPVLHGPIASRNALSAIPRVLGYWCRSGKCYVESSNWQLAISNWQVATSYQPAAVLLLRNVPLGFALVFSTKDYRDTQLEDAFAALFGVLGGEAGL